MQIQQNALRHKGAGPAMGKGINCRIAERRLRPHSRIGIDRIGTSLALRMTAAAGPRWTLLVLN
jgi:hypothetical protein